MREDRLSPIMGKLIDSANTVLAEFSSAGVEAEAVAVLTEDGSIYVGVDTLDAATGCCGAAETALAARAEVGGGEIDAVAVARSPLEDSVVPCADCMAALLDVDPDLPIIVRQLGRWVFVPLSSLEGSR